MSEKRYATTLEEVLALRSENASLRSQLAKAMEEFAANNRRVMDEMTAWRDQEREFIRNEFSEQLVKRTEALQKIADLIDAEDAIEPLDEAIAIAQRALTDEHGAREMTSSERASMERATAEVDAEVDAAITPASGKSD